MPKGKLKKTEGIFERARSVAEHYGFLPLKKILDLAGAHRGGKKIILHPPKDDIPGQADRLSLMHAYLDYSFVALPQPLMLYHSEPLLRSMERNQYGGKSAVQFSLEIMGNSKSVAEAMLFKTAFAILRDAGFENFSVSINSLGDRDSINHFVREFTAYYKKHMEEVPAHCRALLKKDVFKVLECSQEKCMLVKEHAPKPIAALSEDSRAHFTEVLEFLESMAVPYTINNCLVGGKDYYTRTIFEIRTSEPTSHLHPKITVNPVLARGGRFDDLGKRLGGKKEIPAVGMSISMGGLGIIEPKKKSSQKINKKTLVYLIHLGMSAKQQSLSAIEILRKADISVHQSLSRDRISSQVAAAEKMNVPYTIIIGQKEAIEGTVIIRNMSNRSQKTVPLLELPFYLKRTRV
jgi:histidyl-tRNA synthetase